MGLLFSHVLNMIQNDCKIIQKWFWFEKNSLDKREGLAQHYSREKCDSRI